MENVFNYRRVAMVAGIAALTAIFSPMLAKEARLLSWNMSVDSMEPAKAGCDPEVAVALFDEYKKYRNVDASSMAWDAAVEVGLCVNYKPPVKIKRVIEVLDDQYGLKFLLVDLVDGKKTILFVAS